MLQYLRKHQTIADNNDNRTSITTCSLPKVERLRLALEVATGMKFLAQQKVRYKSEHSIRETKLFLKIGPLFRYSTILDKMS